MKTPLPPPEQAPRPVDTTGSSPSMTWSSSQLFGAAREVQILHDGQVYRLRITAMGKLILTK
ncbi:MAG: hemin uptake protein HemP [Burkholderiales bacterium]|nr:hemin uptake protein HemP [Burkholderiales bacterium]